MSSQVRIDDRFVIQDLNRDLIGSGSMGNVYRAHDTQTGKQVAVKVLNQFEISSQSNLVARFVREGEALRRLNHPNIVKMITAVEQESQYFLIMEYIKGGSLRDLMDQKQQISPKRVMEIGIEVADALARTHHLNIIHRDLKPANILLSEEGTPFLSDFGVALDIVSPRLTQFEAIVGTPIYISPEAWNSETLDARADLWALGVIFYEMLAGTPPFTGKKMAEIIDEIVNQEPPNIKTYCPDLNPLLANLIHRLLTKDRNERIVSARIVAAELESILKEQQPTLLSHDLMAQVPKSNNLAPETIGKFFSSQGERSQLRQLLVQNFNVDEFRTLCFDLGIDYDDLPGETLGAKARELLLYCERHDLVNQLLEICRQERVNISWPKSQESKAELFKDQTQPPQEWVPILYKQPGIIEVPRQFFGHQQLIRKINEGLDENNHLILHGLGGIGKTSLAAYVADMRLGVGKGPVMWLRPGKEDSNTIFSALAEEFATPEEMEQINSLVDTARTLVVRKLFTRLGAHLLVIDDAKNGKALYQLLQTVPLNMAVLVTSRQRFGVPISIEVPSLTPDEALSLLAYHAQAQFKDDAHAQELCHMLGYHPYALEIAGTNLQVDGRSPRQLLRRIKASSRDSQMLLHMTAVGRQSITQLLDESWYGLDKGTQAVFLSIGAFWVPTITPDLLAFFMGRATDLVWDELDALVRRSLIKRRNSSDDTEYFTMHELTFTYIRAKYSNQGLSRDITVSLLCNYVIQNSEEYSRLRLDMPNILEAVSRTNTNSQLQVMESLTLGGYFDTQGHSLRYLRTLDDVLEDLEGRLDENRVDGDLINILQAMLGKRGNAYFDRGEYDGAIETYKKIFSLTDDSARHVLVQAVIGKSLAAQKKIDESNAAFLEARQLAEELNDDYLMNFILQQEGWAAGHNGDFEKAHQVAGQQVSILEKHLEQFSEDYTTRVHLFYGLLNLGSAKLDLARQNSEQNSRLEEALLVHIEAERLSEELDNNQLRAHIFTALGEDYHFLGQKDRAKTYYRKALQLWNELGSSQEAETLEIIMQDYEYLDNGF